MGLIEVTTKESSANTTRNGAKRAASKRIPQKSAADTARDGANRTIAAAAGMAVIAATSVIIPLIMTMASSDSGSRENGRSRAAGHHDG